VCACSCGYTGEADVNAGLNIAALGRQSIRP
jgi:transposase